MVQRGIQKEEESGWKKKKNFIGGYFSLPWS